VTGPPSRAGRRPLRRFAAVSGVVTAVDVGVLVALARGAEVPVVAADAVAVGVASVASWLLHREVAGSGDPFARWSERPLAFVGTAVLAGALDVAVVAAVAPARSAGAGALVGAKALALLVAGAVRVVAYRGVLLRPTRRELAVRTSRAEPPGDLRLSVVVPAYDEEERIAGSVRRLAEALAGVDAEGGVEVLVVDDGSSDATAGEAEAAGARVLRLPLNRGKGAAVRAGMLAARGRTVAFVDADLSYPPEQVLRLLAGVESGWDVVVGSRRHPGSVDVAPTGLVRSLSGRLFNVLTAVVLLGHYRDTQCGCKAFRSDVARLVFSRTKLDGFAFDVEVFHLVERYRLSLTEVPVTLVAAPGSTVRVGVDARKMLGDLFRLRRWSGRGAYDLPTGERPGGAAASSGRSAAHPARRTSAGSLRSPEMLGDAAQSARRSS
jgi:putative flippase GtrA